MPQPEEPISHGKIAASGDGNPLETYGSYHVDGDNTAYSLSTM